jgi:hypothetical protein
MQILGGKLFHRHEEKRKEMEGKENPTRLARVLDFRIPFCLNEFGNKADSKRLKSNTKSEQLQELRDFLADPQML